MSEKEEYCKQIVHASVTSKLDYCNVFLYGLPDSVLQILRRVQKFGARIVVTLLGRSEYITQVMITILASSRYADINTILFYIYKALYDHPYVCEIVEFYMPKRSLRSSSQCM